METSFINAWNLLAVPRPHGTMGPLFVQYEKDFNRITGGEKSLFPRINKLKSDGHPDKYVDEDGNDLLAGTESLKTRSIPLRELKRLEQTLEQIHRAVEEGKVGSEEFREFLKMFLLPDPRKAPEAYRLKGRFRPRLFILWGIEPPTGPDSVAVFLPATNVSKNWDDASERKPPNRRLFPLRWHPFFDFRRAARQFAVAVFTLIVLSFVLFLMPQKCEHGKTISNGILGKRDYGRCAVRCPVCHGHADRDGSCPKCWCTICGAKRPLNEQGECEDPPDNERCKKQIGSRNVHYCKAHCAPGQTYCKKHLKPAGTTEDNSP